MTVLDVPFRVQHEMGASRPKTVARRAKRFWWDAIDLLRPCSWSSTTHWVGRRNRYDST